MPPSAVTAKLLPTFLSAVDKSVYKEHPNIGKASELNRTVGFRPDLSKLTRDSEIVEIRFVREKLNPQNKGASAQIFKAYSNSNKFNGSRIPLAVKKMNVSNVCEEDETTHHFYELYNREMFALLSLAYGGRCHHNVIKFYGSFYSGEQEIEFGDHWLTFEWCDGGNLSFMKSLPLNFDHIAAIAAGAINGLHFIHNQGFIHCDIKPENLLLKSPGILKICDFGLTSKVIGVEEPDFHALGTVRYMSPELMLVNVLLDDEDPSEAENYHYSFNTDIWSLGITLLELVLGACPLYFFRDMDKRRKIKVFNEFLIELTHETEPRNKESGLNQILRLPNKYRKRVAERSTEIVDEDLKLLFKRFPRLRRKYSVTDKVNDILSYKSHKFSICIDFIKKCLVCNYEERLNAKDFKDHLFIKQHLSDIEGNMKDMESIEEEYSNYRSRKSFWNTYRGLNMKLLNELINLKYKKTKDSLLEKKYVSKFLEEVEL